MESKLETATDSSPIVVKVEAPDTDERAPPLPLSCQECLDGVALYQCPRCSFRSCSLLCCVAHKKRTGCNGKRDRTAFLPKSGMSDETLYSDFHFLEDVLRQVDCSKRVRRNAGVAGPALDSTRPLHRRRDESHVDDDDQDVQQQPTPVHTLLQAASSTGGSPMLNKIASPARYPHSPFTPPQPEHISAIHPKWRHLQHQAAQRGVQLLLMPSGMERHRNNRSHLRKDVLYWTVEWLIHGPDGATPPVRQYSLASERQCVRDVVPSMTPPIQLDGDQGLPCSRSGLHVLLTKKLPCSSQCPRYVQVSPHVPLRVALTDLTLIEYPTLEVVPLSRIREFPQFIAPVGPEPSDERRNEPGTTTKTTTAATHPAPLLKTSQVPSI